MHLPTWDELIPEQRDILDHPLDQSLFAAGPPGSGKTSLAVHRAVAIKDGRRSVALVTYNRLLRRLVKTLSPGCSFVCTMHEFIGRDYKQRTRKNTPKVPTFEYDHDWAAMLEELGRHPPSGMKFDHVVVDEGQDLPAEFFSYVVNYVAPKISVFADEEQSITDTRSTLEQIKRAALLGDPMLLQVNHRNTPEVARLAEYFHAGRLPVTNVKKPSISVMPRVVYWNAVATIVTRIANHVSTFGGTAGVIVVRNDTGEAVSNELKKVLVGRRVDFYTNKKGNDESIDLDKPGVTVLNAESAKGQEFDTLFILELGRLLPCLGERDRRVMYMLCARARQHLWLVHGPGSFSAAADAALPAHLVQRVP
jgi:superfamily I DNA/RNA helicase